jgi:DNA-binding MarR family transcriptional regulator
VLQDGFLGSPFSLAEGRVLQELARQREGTASAVGKELGLDAGYISRMLRSFDQRGLVRRTRSATDGRQAHLSLTKAGEAAFARLDRQSHDDVSATLERLTPTGRQQLVSAMAVIEKLLGAKPEASTSIVLRPPNAGDLGWVVYRQGLLYAEEWGYNEEFEALAVPSRWRASSCRTRPSASENGLPRNPSWSTPICLV